MLAVEKLLENYEKAIFDNKQLLKELEVKYKDDIISIKEFKLREINLIQANESFASSIKYLNQYMVFCKQERFKE